MTWARGFVLVVLLPQFLSVRQIDFRKTMDMNIENDLFPRDGVESCTEDDSVNLSHLGLSAIPDRVIKSDKILHVDLSFNSLKNIPNRFFRDVPKLECLNLTTNAYAPSVVLNGTSSDSLKTLILDRFPGTISNPCQMTGYFPNLNSLHLSRIIACQIDKSMYEARLPRLTTLYLMDYTSLGGTYIWNLPSTVRHLHLERSNIQGLSAETVTQMESLYLDGTPYATLDKLSINNKLQVLSCRQCGLSNAAVEKFFEYPRNTLRLLDFSSNAISNLTEKMFQQAKNLEGLILSGNKFTKIPDTTILSRLRGLVLNRNQIDQIPAVKSATLKILGLQGNNIAAIYDTTFAGLPALETLDLSENKLFSMPKGWAKNLKNLASLSLKSNYFTKLSDMSLMPTTSDLRQLFMTENPIERIFEQDFLLVPDNCTMYFAVSREIAVQTFMYSLWGSRMNRTSAYKAS